MPTDQTYDLDGGGLLRLLGYTELMRTLAAFDQRAPKVVRDSLRQAGRKVKDDATAQAASWARTGAFRASIGLSNTQRGLKIKSTDPAAGVLEYAHAGATTLSGRRVGTPAGAPNKAITLAVERNEQYVLGELDRALSEALEIVRGA